MRYAQNNDERFVFKMNSPKAEVLWFYMRKDDKFQPEDGKTPSEDDVKFSFGRLGIPWKYWFDEERCLCI
jgi:hypothetical protein